MKRLLALGLVAMTFLPATGFAIPLLQLYIEGANYDSDTDTWVTTSSDFKLWVIANVSGPGGKGGILDVRLAAAFLTSEATSGTITLTPTTTTKSPVTDPSIPDSDPMPGIQAPTVMSGLGADGTRPLLGDNTLLPSHGIYGAGTSFTQYRLGDMLLSDSHIADFSGTSTFPAAGDFFANAGQINVYDVSITGFSQVHFDVFDHVVGKTDSKFAPFSHDAGGGGQVPEPGTLVLLGTGLTSAAGFGFSRRRRRS